MNYNIILILEKLTEMNFHMIELHIFTFSIAELFTTLILFRYELYPLCTLNISSLRKQ